MDVLDLRRLNRASLARQGLLERLDLPLPEVVRRVGGLQAQLPGPPVVGLWSRVAGLAREDYRAHAAAGRLVRGTTLRGTLHVHEVDDYRALRMSVQPVLDTYVRGLGKRVRAEDLEPAIDIGHAAFDEGPQSVADLKARLARAFPESTPQGLAGAVRCTEQLLIVPDGEAPDGWTVNAPFVRASSLVDGPLAPPDDEQLVRRFLACMGPGTVRDAQVWSGRRGLRPVVERLLARGELEEVATWEGDALLDLPGAPRPDGDVVAPPRFLPMWDNLLLSHADRTRVIDPAHRPFLASRNGMTPATFLVDGFVHGTWRLALEAGAATIVLTPFAEIPGRHEAALLAEARALAMFLEPDATDVAVRVG